MRKSASMYLNTPLTSLPPMPLFHGHSVNAGKFDANFKNDKRLQQRLAKCRFDTAVTSSYSEFMPRLHKWLDTLGFDRHLTMPSRAFCSDETQGCPTIQIKRQFGVFPFDHGVVGGLLAVDRHGPHSHHGEDMLLVQASHVGVDDETGLYGAVRRVKMRGGDLGATCGKLCGAIEPFIDDYELCINTTLATIRDDGRVMIDVDTQFLQKDRPMGTVLKYDKLFAKALDNQFLPPQNVSSIRASFFASETFASHFITTLERERTVKGAPPVEKNKPMPIGRALTARYFSCVYHSPPLDEPHSVVLANLIPTMPAIVTHEHPALAAAIANTQAEFESSYRSVSSTPHYKGRNFMYIAGINVDVSPSKEAAQQHRSEFMRTRFIPWAAYYHTRDGRRELLEQEEVALKLSSFAEVTAEETRHREESLFSTSPDKYGVQ